MPTGHASLMPTLRRAVLAGAADRTDGQLLGAFVADGDADAFGVLVRRHGPMVLGVCRRVLADHAAADDAFQAVFLVLARRAAAVRPRERVGNWLYGVAYRTALKARAALARRRSREKQVPVMPEPPAAPPRDDWADLRPVLDEELAALPEKLRTPVVLCDLEGRPQREVARALGLPPATLATRLAAARRTLARRLTRRGVALSGGALAGLLAANGASAAVPVALARPLAGAAEAIASGAAYSALVSANAVHLSEGVLRMMTLTKLKALAVAAITTAAVTSGLGLGLAPARGQAPGDAPQPAPRVAAAPAPAAQPPAAATDAAFLRRACLDLRGTPPTDIETFFFVTDADPQKRTKLVNWLLGDADTRAFVEERLASPLYCFHVGPPMDAKEREDGRVVVLFQVLKPEKRVHALALAADGTDLADGLAAATQEAKLLYRDPTTGGRVVVWDVAEGGAAAIRKQSESKVREHRVAQAAQAAEAELRKDQSGEAQKFQRAFQRFVQEFNAADGDEQRAVQRYLEFAVSTKESDLDFLMRVTAAARGTPPTALEVKYFTEDKDPKKREKLLDTLLKEPAVAKKLGDDFKKRMLVAAPQDVLKPGGFWYNSLSQPDGKPAIPEKTPHKAAPAPQPPGWKFEKSFRFDVPPRVVLPEFEFNYTVPLLDGKPYTVPLLDGKPFAVPLPPVPPKAPAEPAPAARPKPPAPPQPPTPPAARGDRLGKLIDELLAAKKTDAEVLEAVTLAAGGRLPTEAEKRLTLALMAKTTDRKAAWREVANALSGEPEPGAKWEFRVVPTRR